MRAAQPIGGCRFTAPSEPFSEILRLLTLNEAWALLYPTERLEPFKDGRVL